MRVERDAQRNRDRLADSIRNLALQYLTVTAAIATARRALAEWTETERGELAAQRAFARTEGLFGRMQELSNAVSRLTGVDDDLILAQTRVLYTLGATEQQVKRLTPLVLDLAAARGIDVEQASAAVIQGILGRQRALQRLGIAYKATGDRAKDLLALEKALSARGLGGAAEAARQTAFGRQQALTTELGNRLSDLGRLLDLRTRGAQELAIRGLADPGLLDRFLTLSRNMFPAFAGLIPRGLTPAERAAEEKRQQELAKRGAGGGETAEQLLERLLGEAKKGNELQEQLVRQGFGPQGLAGIRAGNIRTLRAAIRSGL